MSEEVRAREGIISIQNVFVGDVGSTEIDNFVITYGHFAINFRFPKIFLLFLQSVTIAVIFSLRPNPLILHFARGKKSKVATVETGTKIFAVVFLIEKYLPA